MPRRREAPVREIEQLETWVREGDFERALEALEKLTRRYPDDPDVLSLQLASLMESGHHQEAISIALRLVDLEPTVPEHRYNLALAYGHNGFLALAFQEGQEFIRGWPHHPLTPKAQEVVDLTKSLIAEEVERLGLPSESALEILVLHEQAQIAMHEQRIRELERIVRKLQELAPHFVAPLNNLALGYIHHGRMDEAIEIEREVRKRDPDDVNALSNLIHALVLSGCPEEVQEIGEHLKGIHAVDERLAKKLEGLSWARMDQAVLDTFRQAKESDEIPDISIMGLAYHYAAVAAARLGHEKQARNWWNQALKIFPGLDKARENLEDLRLPPGERQGAWPFTMLEWLPRTWLKDLASVPSSSRATERHLRQAFTRFLKRYPQFISLAPILLERGDAGARELVYHITAVTEHPDLQIALRDFALGRWGTDEQRLRAAQHCANQGLLPRDQTIQIWQRGEQREILLFGWEITFEPSSRLPPKAEKLMEKAVTALQESRLDEAEEALQKGLKLMPDHPSFLQNLAVVYMSRGEVEKAHALTRQIIERNPDYAIGRCNLAASLAREGKVEEAQSLIDPVMKREQLHISEFVALCHAQIEILLAENQREGAEAWMRMLEEADPDNPAVPALRRRVGRFSISGLLHRLRPGQG